MNFPCTMDDLREDHGLVQGWWHVYGERNGLRYFMRSISNLPDAELFALDRKREHPDTSFYICSRTGSTCIHGLWNHLINTKNIERDAHGWLKEDHIEKFGAKKRARIVKAWRIVDAEGKDLIQPWMNSRREAIETAKALGIRIENS